MFVKPVDDRKVRDPHSMLHIPASGANVPDNDPFWHRRIAEGDVVVVADAPTASTPKAK
jgi:hypothetical protein